MAQVLRRLRSSQPVARFQRCCGLFPAAEEGAGDGLAGTVGGGDHLQARDTCPGSSPARQRLPEANGVKSSPQPQIVMYIGQVTKDILKWPRPHSPPVVKLEMRAEYGMPSTHAMAATSISFTFCIATINQNKYSLALGLMAAFVFSTLVCLSRLYTGMHTVLDVIGGTLISAALIALTYPAWDIIDHLMLTSPFCPILSIVVPLLLCYNYPKLEDYSPTRADTTTVLGAGAGATIGFWLNNLYAAPNYPNESLHLNLPPISEMMMVVLAKFLVGVFILLVTRYFIKGMALRVLCSRYQVSVNNLEARRRLEIEVPYKFITYSSVGFSATVLVPLVHDLLGLI
ncbi:sphingosine-1-phosphate phosphatase 2 isoform X2 [Malaclemys terrapin pileata]|uniref:sphingosine-1-phosphate phosphatase 2 isoform X2 n=1 Tax=Malaclemys terrapin pileata TaxID=2991368 RepID=UPI0023A79A25|nr:sphingosine-1-phosphate phosphatase 2 isoform X2 [Malaclemys terrapin pileata]